MATFKSRFPSFEQILPVYAVIVLMVYGWTIISFFWKLPSWMFFLNAGEILLNLIYSLSTNFIESIVVLCIPILISFTLPRKWFLDAFVARSAAFLLPGLGYMMYIAYQFRAKMPYPSINLKWWSLSLFVLILALLIFLAGRVKSFKKILEFIADRATIFVYIAAPISIISLVMLIIINL